MTPNPPTYTEGLGEVIRALRNYTGMSKVGMAIKLGMARRSYQRIENGDDPCPPGLLDTIGEIIDQFDREVEEALALVGSGMDVGVPVSDDPREEWRRAVIGRASVEDARITPILVGEHREAG